MFHFGYILAVLNCKYCSQECRHLQEKANVFEKSYGF